MKSDLSVKHMQSENVNSATSQVLERMLLYEMSKNVFDELISTEHIERTVSHLKEAMFNGAYPQKHKALYSQFTRLVSLLPEDENRKIRNAIKNNDIEFIQGYFKAYFDRFLRLLYIDRKYKCRERLFDEPFPTFNFTNIGPHTKENITGSFIERYNHVLAFMKNGLATKRDQLRLYDLLVHDNDCDMVFSAAKQGSKHGNCERMMPAMNKCFKQRLCANTLVFNNLPENLDSGHAHALDILDCKNLDNYTDVYDADVTKLSTTIAQFANSESTKKTLPKAPTKRGASPRSRPSSASSTSPSHGKPETKKMKPTKASN